MSTKKPPPNHDDSKNGAKHGKRKGDDDHDDDDDDDKDEEVDENDEDEDDEEDEFVPGADEEDDEEDDDVDDDEDAEDGDDASGPWLEGRLSLDQEMLLHYQGEGFHLVSTKPVSWNLLDQNAKPKDSLYAIEMEGPCDIVVDKTEPDNPTHRKMEVIWSVHGGVDEPANGTSRSRGRREKRGSNGNTTEKNGEDSKMPSLCYKVHGRQLETTGKGETTTTAWEFYGSFVPPKDGSNDVCLSCRVHMVSGQPHVSAAAAAAKPAAAAAAANAESEEDDEDADDEVDYEELIALHEDAGLSVDALQKKYRPREEPVNSMPSKKGKTQSEEDDDDYGF